MLCKIHHLIFLILLFELCQGNAIQSRDLKAEGAKRNPRGLLSDLLSYFDDTSYEDDDDSSAEDYSWSDEKEDKPKHKNRKYEICRDCNISYQNLNSVQHHYYQQMETTTKRPTSTTTTPSSATKIPKTTTTTPITRATNNSNTTNGDKGDTANGNMEARDSNAIAMTPTPMDVTLPPAPVPLEPLLEPSESMPSEEAFTSENV